MELRLTWSPLFEGYVGNSGKLPGFNHYQKKNLIFINK